MREDSELKALLDAEEQLERIHKLRLEQDALIRKPRDWIDYVTAFGTPISVTVGILALVISYYEWSIAQKSTNTDRLEARYEKGIEYLDDQTPEKRISGTISLQRFLTPDPELAPFQARTLASLARALAIERDPSVRSTILEVFRTTTLSALPRESLNQAQILLLFLNRSLTEGNKLYISRTPASSDPLPDSAEARARDLSTVISILVSQGCSVTDYSATYLINANFSGANLTGCNFNSCLLEGATFQRASAEGATFVNSSLGATDFSSAHLKGANFSVVAVRESAEPPKQGEIDTRGWPKIAHTWGQPEQDSISVETSNFSYADLENANFTGRPLVTVYSPQPYIIGGANSFTGSKLAGANFENAQYIWVVSPKNVHIWIGSALSGTVNSVNFGQYSADSPANFRDSDLQNFSPLFHELRDSLSGSVGWEKALWGTQIGAWLKASPPQSNP